MHPDGTAPPGARAATTAFERERQLELAIARARRQCEFGVGGHDDFNIVEYRYIS